MIAMPLMCEDLAHLGTCEISPLIGDRSGNQQRFRRRRVSKATATLETGRKAVLGAVGERWMGHRAGARSEEVQSGSWCSGSGPGGFAR